MVRQQHSNGKEHVPPTVPPPCNKTLCEKNTDAFSAEYYVTFVRKFLNPRRVVNLTSKHRHAEGYNIIDIIHIISQLYFYLSHLLYSLLFILQQRGRILLIDYSTFICLGIIIIKVQAVLHAQLQYIQKSNTIFRSSTSISLSEYIISVGPQSVTAGKLPLCSLV